MGTPAFNEMARRSLRGDALSRRSALAAAPQTAIGTFVLYQLAIDGFNRIVVNGRG